MKKSRWIKTPRVVIQHPRRSVLSNRKLPRAKLKRKLRPSCKKLQQSNLKQPLPARKPPVLPPLAPARAHPAQVPISRPGLVERWSFHSTRSADVAFDICLWGKSHARHALLCFCELPTLCSCGVNVFLANTDLTFLLSPSKLPTSFCQRRMVEQCQEPGMMRCQKLVSGAELVIHATCTEFRC